MRNIDFIYLINLDQRPEKYEYCINQLSKYGINPYRFSAVNGWELSLEAINDIGLKFGPGMQQGIKATSYPLDNNFQPLHGLTENYGQTYFCHCTARGTIGCTMSHLSVLQDAYDSGYETIWIMEDDIRLDQDPHLISELIDKLDALVGWRNWDILFTDRDIRDKNDNYVPAYGAAIRPDCTFTNTGISREPISADFRRLEARFGTHSMIFTRSGIEKMLAYFKEHQMFLPYDLEISYPEGIRMFTVLEDVVTNTPRAISDNGSPGYLKPKKL